jgi:hypothetical protein
MRSDARIFQPSALIKIRALTLTAERDIHSPEARWLMRFALPLVKLCASSSAPLRGDMFDITLTPIPGSVLSRSGILTTDGTCVICTPASVGGSGLLSLTINVDISTGPDAFDITDDSMGPGGPLFAIYLRPTNSLGLGRVQTSKTEISVQTVNSPSKPHILG